MSADRPHFVDPRTFLEDRPRGLISAALIEEEPTIELIRWTTTLRLETGFIYLGPHFFIVRGFEEGIPDYLMPTTANMLLHTHPAKDSPKPRYFPNISDFLNASKTAVNLIASGEGITQYWAPDDGQRQNLMSYLYGGENEVPQELNFPPVLKSLGDRFLKHSWEEIGERKLSTIFLKNQA